MDIIRRGSNAFKFQEVVIPSREEIRVFRLIGIGEWILLYSRLQFRR